MSTIRRTHRGNFGSSGLFPNHILATHHYQHPSENGKRVSLELERIWKIQQNLFLPHGKLSELVDSALHAIHAPAKRIGMAMWVDMLLAIQQAIDQQIERARAITHGIGTQQQSRGGCSHRITAQIIAYFYIGLLDVSPLGNVEMNKEAQPTSLSGHLRHHARAQRWTQEALNHLHQSGLKSPDEFTPLIALIHVLINALHGLEDPPDGFLHMITPATTDAPYSSECLYAYALTQMQKGKLDRATRVFDVCKNNSLRREQRLLAALLLPDLSFSHGSSNTGPYPSSFIEERQSILKDWLGRSEDEKNETDAEGLLATRRADRIQCALIFIESHLGGKFTTTEVASACGVSTRTISEDFRAVFHKTVLAYVTEERMRVALQLLKDRSLPLEVVSKKVGFTTSFGFTKAFMRIYGHMPVRVISSE